MDELLETHLPEPHHHVAAPSPEVLPAPSKLSTTTPSPPNRKQKAKAVPKAPAKRRRRHDKSRSRSSSPLSFWTFEDKQKLRTLKADEKSRFSWRVISTKMGKSEEDVRSMWNKIKDRLGWPPVTRKQEKDVPRHRVTFSIPELLCIYSSWRQGIALPRTILFHYHNLFGMVARLKPWTSTLYTPPAVYYVSPHSAWSILPTASYGPRQYLSYPTITLSNQGTVSRYGFFAFSAPTRPDISTFYTPSTGYFPIGPETYAAIGRQKPILQHPGPQGRGQPLHWRIWQPVPDFQGDLPGLRPQSFRFRPKNSGHGHASTEMVDTLTGDGFLHDDRHRSRSSDAWWPPSFSPGHFELVLPVMESSSTSRCLHVPWLSTFVADTPSRSTRHGLRCPSSSDSSRASIRHRHPIH